MPLLSSLLAQPDTQAIITPNGLRIRFLEVTPDMARQWLTFNVHNRNMRGMVVAQWTNEMRSGEWVQDIDPIAFHGFLDDTRRDAESCGCPSTVHPILLNGQHRLESCAQANKPISWIVVEGLEMRAQVEMDTGTRRRLDDQLRIKGISSADQVAAILRICYLWEKGELRSKQIGPSYAALLRWFDENPSIVEVIGPSRRLWSTVGGRQSVWGASRWILLQLSPKMSHLDDVEDFFDKLLSGENQKFGDPIYALRQKILMTRSPSVGRKRMSQIEMLALVFKAWNYWQDGTYIQHLQWRGGGKNPEPFPMPVTNA